MKRFIQMTGTGSASAVPDFTFVRVEVEAKGKEKQLAASSQTKKMHAVLGCILENGVEEKDILHGQYQCQENFDYAGKEQARVKVGYIAQQTATIKVRREKVEELVGDLNKLSIENGVDGYDFSPEQKRQLEKDATTNALRDAKEKAQHVATELGCELGPVMQYWEGSNDSYRRPAMGLRTMALAAAPEAAETDPEIAMGERTVKKAVTIVYFIAGSPDDDNLSIL